MTPARPVLRRDGYLPIETHGLIGDGRGCALGGISWMCVPRFDSPPLFCGLLDRHRGLQPCLRDLQWRGADRALHGG